MDSISVITHLNEIHNLLYDKGFLEYLKLTDENYGVNSMQQLKQTQSEFNKLEQLIYGCE